MPVIIATLDTEQGEFRWFRYSLSTQPGHDTIVSATTPYALDTTCIMYNWTGLHGALDRTRGMISMMVSILVFTGHDVHLTLSVLVKPFDAPTRALTPLMDVRHGHVRHGHVPDVPPCPAVRWSCPYVASQTFPMAIQSCPVACAVLFSSPSSEA